LLADHWLVNVELTQQPLTEQGITTLVQVQYQENKSQSTVRFVVSLYI